MERPSLMWMHERVTDNIQASMWSKLVIYDGH